MLSKKRVAYIFWLVIILYLDPGGYQYFYLEPIQKTTLRILFLITALLCFNYAINKPISKFLRLKYIRSYLLVAFIWLSYYFVVFYGLNNDFYPGVIRSLLRNIDVIFKVLIVVPIAYFTVVSLNIFYELLIQSTIVIGLLFLITVFVGIEIIPRFTMDRGMGGLTRNLMYGYGLMYFVMPISLTLYFVKIQLGFKLKLAFILVLSIILVTIFRRDIVGFFEYVLIIALIVNYIQSKRVLWFLNKIVKTKYIFFGMFFFLVVIIFVPSIVEMVILLVENSLINLGLLDSYNSSSSVNDVRLSLFAKTGIVDAIRNNVLFGTGYNEAWNTGDGGSNGWEGADYVFLASFAMYGLVGLFVFIPFYVLYIKIVLDFFKVIKGKMVLIQKLGSTLLLPIVIGIASSAEIFKNILEYPNWFYPIGAIIDNSKYFIFLGLLLGSYYNFNHTFKRFRFEY